MSDGKKDDFVNEILTCLTTPSEGFYWCVTLKNHTKKNILSLKIQYTPFSFCVMKVWPCYVFDKIILSQRPHWILELWFHIIQELVCGETLSLIWFVDSLWHHGWMGPMIFIWPTHFLLNDFETLQSRLSPFLNGLSQLIVLPVFLVFCQVIAVPLM